MLDPADWTTIRRWTCRCWVALAAASLPAGLVASWIASPTLGALGKALFLVYGVPVLVLGMVQGIRQLLTAVNGQPPRTARASR